MTIGEQVKLLSLVSKVKAVNTRVTLRCSGNLNENIIVTRFRIPKTDSEKHLIIRRYKNLIHFYIFEGLEVFCVVKPCRLIRL